MAVKSPSHSNTSFATMYNLYNGSGVAWAHLSQYMTANGNVPTTCVDGDSIQVGDAPFSIFQASASAADVTLTLADPTVNGVSIPGEGQMVRVFAPIASAHKVRVNPTTVSSASIVSFTHCDLGASLSYADFVWHADTSGGAAAKGWMLAGVSGTITLS